MAKQNILKIEILASIKDVKDIVDLVQRKEIIELSDIPDDDLVDKLSTSQSFGFYEKYLNESQDALKILPRVERSAGIHYSAERKSFTCAVSRKRG